VVRLRLHTYLDSAGLRHFYSLDLMHFRLEIKSNKRFVCTHQADRTGRANIQDVRFFLTAAERWELFCKLHLGHYSRTYGHSTLSHVKTDTLF
jgi:hypothetical protein